MTLTAADVAEIMRLVEQSTFDELTLELDGMKLSLRRGAAPATVPAEAATSAPADPAGTVSALGERPAPRATPAPSSDPTLQHVAAPMLGTFYRAPKPGAPPFVEVGTAVEDDTIVAIIEVMKLMNSVRAGVRGVVTEIVGVDGALVEYGQILLRVRRAAG